MGTEDKGLSEKEIEFLLRKKTEEALKKQQQDFQIIFDSVPVMVWSKDKLGRYMQVNKFYCESVGLLKDNIIGKTDYELYPKEIADQYNKYDKVVINSRKPVLRIVEHHLKPSGEVGWSQTDKSPSYDSVGNIIGTIGFAGDITEIKKAEGALKESEEKYRLLIDGATEGVIVAQDGLIKFFNKAFLSLLGYSEEDVISKPFINFIHPDDGGIVLRMHKARLKGENLPDLYSFRVLSKKGDIIWVELKTVVINWDNAPATLNFLRDITDRKKAEQALIESEEKFSKLFNLSPNVNIITTFGEGVILDVNKAFEDELGIPREEAIGKKSSDFNFVDSKTRKDAYVRLEKEGLAITDIEAVVKGQKRYGRIFAKEIEFNGKKCIFQSIIDITEQKLAEERIKEDEKKLRGSLAMSARQNIQLHRLLKEKIQMQEKIHQYAKQLEVKIKTLENKIPLTSKEKIVLYGLTALPMLNDEQLSQKLKIKRSTVTSIRHRLKEEKWFFTLMIPNFYALGCEMSSLIHCNFNTNIKERKNLGITDEILNHPEIVFFGEDDNKSIGLFISKNFVSIKKYLDNSLMVKQNVLNKEMEILSFFSELIMIKKPDFSGILNELFDLHFPKLKKEIIGAKNTPESLNKNERRVLCALVEFPEYSIAGISKKLWLSKPTVSAIKKKLVAGHFLLPLIVPNLSMLPLELGLIMSSKFNPSISKKVNLLENDIEKLENSTVLKIIGNNEITSLMLFRNKEECDKELAKIRGFCIKNEIMPTNVKTIFFPIKGKSMSTKLDFLTLAKQLVFPESF